LKEWKFDEKEINAEWVNASIRIQEDNGEDYECWKRDKWIKELVKDDIGFIPSKKQKKLTNAERRERNRRDELKIDYNMEMNCPRKLKVEEILNKSIKWKGEDTQKAKAKWEGKNQRKKVAQQEANGAIKQLLLLEWREKHDAELIWTAIKEKEGRRLSKWEAYIKMKLLEQIGRVENEKVLTRVRNSNKIFINLTSFTVFNIDLNSRWYVNTNALFQTD
jgi:hypothetical protein